MGSSVALQSKQRLRLLAISLSVAVSCLLLAGKFYAYWLTGSAAILSDALESIINVVASAFALVAVVTAAKPPDPSHPYGHGKIEYVAAGFEGALIILAALGILYESLKQILQPAPLPHLDLGLGLILGITAINLVLGLILIYTGRRTDSLVLVADGKHVLSDVLTSAGVLAGLALILLSGWLWLDGVVALLVGVNILFTGGQLLRQSVSGLLDAADMALLQQISEVLRQHRKSIWIDIHQLRARRAGDRIYLDFHLILPRDLTLEEGHREVKELERIFQAHFQGEAEVHIHLDPCDDLECPVCGYDPCQIRQQELARQRLWRQDILTGGREDWPPAQPRSETQPRAAQPAARETSQEVQMAEACVPLRREMLPSPLDFQVEVADFAQARQVAEAKAREVAGDTLLVAWFDRRRQLASPQLECCREDLPAWLAYALSRGADLIIDLNHEEYVFCFRRL